MGNRAWVPTHLAFPLVFILFGLVISACGRSTRDEALPSKTTAPPSPTSAVATEAPVPTERSILRKTPFPIATISPTAAPSQLPDIGNPSGVPPEVQAGPRLSPENASQVVELAGWGEDYDFDLSTIRSSQVFSSGEVLIAYEDLTNFPDAPHATRTRIWELPSGRLRLEMAHPLGYEKLFISPGWNHYATFRGRCPSETPETCVLEVWDIPRDERVLSVELNYLEAAVFSPDNRWIALAPGEEIQIWDLAKAELIHSLPESFHFDRFQFSNNGKLLAGFQQITENVRVWQVETGRLLATLASPADSGAIIPEAVAFSPGDTHLAVGCNGTISLWDTASWREGIAWTGHESRVTEIAFSPDGRLVASGAEDGSVALADTDTGEVLKTLYGHSDGVKDLSFTRDGKLLISTSLDGTLRFWGIAGE